MRGGKREGAGRPKGSPTKKMNRASIYEYFSEADVAEYFEFLKDNYKEDMRLFQWVGDHLLGKAPQAITGPEGGALQLVFDNSFKKDAST